MALKNNDSLMEDLENAVAFRLFSDRQLPTLTVSEQIAAEVGDNIIKGRLEPGSALNEQTLANQFQVSRGPVRDAIRILEREGLATIYPRRGAVVTVLSLDEVREIFEVRAGLFDVIARKIAAYHTPQYLALLSAGVEKLQELAALEDDHGKYAEMSYRLSVLSARNCNNRRLTNMATALSLQTLRYAYMSLASKERRKASAKLWKDSVAALKQGDSQRFISLARQKIEESGKAAIARLEDAEPSVQRLARK